MINKNIIKILKILKTDIKQKVKENKNLMKSEKKNYVLKEFYSDDNEELKRILKDIDAKIKFLKKDKSKNNKLSDFIEKINLDDL